MKNNSTFILFLATILSLNTIYAQTKKAGPIAKQKQVKPEIDRLADKYKDTPSVTLFTSFGELFGTCTVDNNNDDKPQAVTIESNSLNKDAIYEFLTGMINQKKKQGYKLSNDNIYDESIIMGNSDNVLLYKKGSMYFILKGGCCKQLYVDISDEDVFLKPGEKKYGYKSFYWFVIETGDNNRKGGKKATKFDF